VIPGRAVAAPRSTGYLSTITRCRFTATSHPSTAASPIVRHLYVHVPFCGRRCSYCDFAIAVRSRVPAERFVAAVETEYRTRRAAEEWERTGFATVYLGGGTPSRLPPDHVRRLLDLFPRSPGAEVTVEANPDDVTPRAVSAWRAAGVNRVSLGVQSLDDRVLAWMHRLHDAAGTRRAYAVLRDEGIPSVSVDLIFALPERLAHDLSADLDAILALGPDHVSAYGLTLEPRTPYARWAARGAVTPAGDDRYAAEFLRVHDALTGAGYEHYEVSSYARRGARSRHNTAYWMGDDYAGLGPAAHGLRGRERRWNLREWAAYEPVAASGRDPVGGRELLDDRQRRLERVYLGLRTVEGLAAVDADRLASGPLLAAIRAGWLTRGDRLLPTPAGWLVLDALTSSLTTFTEGG
jgi:oxygen-independent coproporphyrinogen-3 oxidase